jgi:hypothetical protein
MSIRYTKWLSNIQNDRKNANIFHSKALQKISKLGILVGNYTIWQPYPGAKPTTFKSTIRTPALQYICRLERFKVGKHIFYPKNAVRYLLRCEFFTALAL